MLHLKPTGRKREMRIVSYERLERHDFETMLALGVLYQRESCNPLPENFYLRNALKRKTKKILGRFKEWGSY